MVIFGGLEAFLLAEKIAQENISVVVLDPRSSPNSFENFHTDNDENVVKLVQKGVRVGIGISAPEEVSKTDKTRFLKKRMGYSKLFPRFIPRLSFFLGSISPMGTRLFNNTWTHI